MNKVPQAFDIPLSKTNKTPPVAKRLANSPRNASPSSLEEIKKRIDNARNRKEELLSSAKVTAQNAEKERVKADFEARIAEEANALRDATKKKLQKAATKREGERLSWLGRLQQSSLLGKDKASLLYEESEQKSKELEISLQQKITAAEVRREENIKKNVHELASKNENKIQRGKAALASVDADARRLESNIEDKIVKANLRKEAKIKETIQHLSSKNETKLVKGQVALSSQTHLAQKTMQHSLKKQDIAAKKREGLVLEQVESLQKSATKKEQRVAEKAIQEEESSKALQKALSAKLITAELARDELLNAKVNKAMADDQTRTEKAKAAAYKDVKMQKEISTLAQDRILKAEVRKEKIQQEKIAAVVSASKKKIPSPRGGGGGGGSTESALVLAEIEEKLQSASKRRDDFLASRSSSTKRAHSPRGLPGSLTMKDITTKLNSAAERREIYLKNKVSKATGSPREVVDSVSKNLSFSSVSPSASPNHGVHSPRIKAARLEARSNDNDPLPPYLTPWLLSSVAFALLGMMAIARFSGSK